MPFAQEEWTPRQKKDWKDLPGLGFHQREAAAHLQETIPAEIVSLE